MPSDDIRCDAVRSRNWVLLYATLAIRCCQMVPAGIGCYPTPSDAIRHHPMLSDGVPSRHLVLSDAISLRRVLVGGSGVFRGPAAVLLLYVVVGGAWWVVAGVSLLAGGGGAAPGRRGVGGGGSRQHN